VSSYRTLSTASIPTQIGNGVGNGCSLQQAATSIEITALNAATTFTSLWSSAP